ncbi:MAG: carbohydrate-binding protein, partial [Bacteroidota bacterium]
MFFVLLLTFSSMAQAANTNLIANPGFESGSQNPLNWQLLDNYGNTPIWDTIAHSGTRSVKIQITGTSDRVSGSARSDTIEVQPLSNYTLSAWGKTENTGGTNSPAVVVAELDIKKNLIQQTKLKFSKGTNPWIMKELTFKTRTSTRYVYVYAVIKNGYGTFWVDDVSLSQYEPATADTSLLTTTTAQPTSTPMAVDTVTATQTQSPYGGTPRSIPGTIQAEDFDSGGEGIAYHDLDSYNQGGQYRPTEGVDLETTTDTGAGYNVGWIQSGEWLEYTTTVSTAGTYTVQTRVASNGNGGTFHIEFDGVDKTGPLTIPNTGGWQNWQTLSKTVTLTQGQQVMKIVMDTNGATGSVGNINHISITSSTPSPAPSPVPTSPQTQSPYGGTPRSIPGTIQAEDFDSGGEGIAYHDLESSNIGGQYRPTEGVDLETTADTGTGYNVGWIQSGEWLEYTTTVSTAGTYTVQTRVASNGNGGTFHIEFNGVDKTGPLTIPNTGGWQNWQTLSKTVTLTQGQQVMKIVMDTNGATGSVGNINHISITSSTSSPAPSPVPTSPPTSIVPNAYYVATNGNDANPGTEASPWRTIQKAANTLTAGKTVYVKSGTYNEQVTVKNSGSAGKYITFSAYPGNTVTIDGAGINMDFGYGRDGGLFQ